MRALFLVSSLLLSSTVAQAGKPPATDRVAFWDLQLQGNATFPRLQEAREKISQAVARGDSQEYFLWSLKESELSGALLGDMILDAQVIESLQMQLLWGGRQLHLLGGMDLEDTYRMLPEITTQVQTFAKRHHSFFLILRGSLLIKKEQEAQGRLAQFEEQERVLDLHRGHEKFKERVAYWETKGVLGALWNWIKSHSRREAQMQQVDPALLKRAVRASERAELPAWTDEDPLRMSWGEAGIAVPVEYAEALIEAFWSGLAARAGHLLDRADTPGQRFRALMEFLQRLGKIQKFSQLDGTDVKQSCVASLAAKKRN